MLPHWQENIHKHTAAELARWLLDNPIDRHLIDVEDREHGCGKDVQDGLCELFAGARTVRCAVSEDVRSDGHRDGHDVRWRLTGARSQRRS
jgi:hypothetical protein